MSETNLKGILAERDYVGDDYSNFTFYGEGAKNMEPVDFERAFAMGEEELIRLVELVASYIDGAPQYWNPADARVFIAMAKRMADCGETVGMDVVKSRGENVVHLRAHRRPRAEILDHGNPDDVMIPVPGLPDGSA